MAVYKLIACIFLCVFLSNAIAQTAKPGAADGYVQFTSDGATYGIKSFAGNEMKITAELKYSGATPELLLALYANPLTRDTLILYLYDENGLQAGTAPIFSKKAKLLFVYKLFGKGTMMKAVDNAKGEITNLDYVNLTKLEVKPGGSVEGSFSFTDINFKNNTGKVVAKIKSVNNGRFKTQITQYNEITGANKNETTTGNTTGKLSAVAALLFKNVKCKLTDDEKNEIASSTGFVLSGKKDEPFAMDKESMDYPYSALVTITDMNKDGIEEVFIQFGNTFTSGNAGQSIALYIKNKQGKYAMNLGFPGVDPQQQKTGFGGYPDLLIGGPGMQAPIWRWDGKEYKFYKTMKY